MRLTSYPVRAKYGHGRRGRRHTGEVMHARAMESWRNRLTLVQQRAFDLAHAFLWCAETGKRMGVQLLLGRAHGIVKYRRFGPMGYSIVKVRFHRTPCGCRLLQTVARSSSAPRDVAAKPHCTAQLSADMWTWPWISSRPTRAWCVCNHLLTISPYPTCFGCINWAWH